jgi:hypothetical protein
MSQRDFTLQQYNLLCQHLNELGYQSLTISEYMHRQDDDDLPQKVVLLRHDVDSRPQHAKKLGLIENETGLRATYYFRTIKSVFHPESMQTLQAWGHEIGYHYETLAQADGDMTQAISLFGDELSRMRQHVTVTSASMHGSPLKPLDNREIWQHTSPADFDLVGEAYLDIDYKRIEYLNDSGRTWHPTRYNLRDHTGETNDAWQNLDSTPDMMRYLATHQPRRICLSTHPERWHDNGFNWTLQMGRDVAINSIKMLIKRLRPPQVYVNNR